MLVKLNKRFVTVSTIVIYNNGKKKLAGLKKIFKIRVVIRIEVRVKGFKPSSSGGSF